MAGLTPARLQRCRDVAAGRTRRLLPVFDDVYKSRNIGALLRTCDALGLQEVHALEQRAAVIEDGETSMGAGRWVDLICHRRHDFPVQDRLYAAEVAREPGAEANVRRALEGLRARGYRLAVADLASGALSLADIPLDQPLAVIIGNEYAGASPTALALADYRFCLPMQGFAQSLNLATFAGIALHHLAERLRATPGWQLTPEEQAALVDKWAAQA
jgi:tRNA (guanosine-2'-O-)-methyltransferase